MPNIMQQRRDLANNWINKNPVLADGEVGIITDLLPNQIKIGDGVKSWNDLTYTYVPYGFGFGTLLKSLIDNSSFELQNTGFYSCRLTTIKDGLPSGRYSFIPLPIDSLNMSIMAINIELNDIYVNSKNNGTWSGWKKSGTGEEVDTSEYNSVMFSTAGDFFFKIPKGKKKIYIDGCGAGGGGQGTYGLAGGSAECALSITKDVNEEETLTIHVGLGGVGSPASVALANSTPGGNGESTTITGSFGTITLKGGTGGLTDRYVPGIRGGAGGQRGGCPSQAKTGSDGNIIRVGGKGGDCLFGAGGQGGFYSPIQGDLGNFHNGENGIGNGAGGGGGGNNPISAGSAGGNGADGMVKINF